MPNLQKSLVKAALIAEMQKTLITRRQATKEAHEAAIHEEGKAEDDYDTRGIEASYLANAQAHRADALDAAIKRIETTTLKSFTQDDPIANGALVKLSSEKKETWVFVLADGAGFTVLSGQNSIAVISPKSPLGSELLGRECGDSFTLQTQGQTREYEIVEIL